RLRPHELADRDRAATARLRLDQDRLAERFAHPLADDARDHVDATARRERDEQADRAAGVRGVGGRRRFRDAYREHGGEYPAGVGWVEGSEAHPTTRPFCFARAAAAILVSVIAGVLASGSILSWMTAGLPDARAALKAAGKSSVFSTSTPKPPNDFA